MSTKSGPGIHTMPCQKNWTDVWFQTESPLDFELHLAVRLNDAHRIQMILDSGRVHVDCQDEVRKMRKSNQTASFYPHQAVKMNERFWLMFSIIWLVDRLAMRLASSAASKSSSKLTVKWLITRFFWQNWFDFFFLRRKPRSQSVANCYRFNRKSWRSRILFSANKQD